MARQAEIVAEDIQEKVMTLTCFLLTTTITNIQSERVSDFVESSFKSSFELLEFLLDEFFCDKIYRLICSTILAGISTR